MIKKVLGKGKRLGLMMVTAIVGMFAVASSASASGGGSEAIDFGSGGFSFSLADIMTSAWNFIAGFNTYVILILALILVPTLVGFVIWLMSKVPRFRKSS